MIEEKIDALAASIESLAAQLQNETLKEILARDTIDLLTLTFRTHMLHRHYIQISSHQRLLPLIRVRVDDPIDQIQPATAPRSTKAKDGIWGTAA